MAQRITRRFLRRLRNEIDIAHLTGDILDVPCKTSHGYFRFLCPLCGEFNTAVNPETNLGRCFRCEKNFNPIDMVIAVRESTFLEAVEFLQALL